MITKRGILISTVGFGVGCPSTPTPRLIYHPLEAMYGKQLQPIRRSLLVSEG